jgi:FkbM family methyltransferase
MDRVRAMENRLIFDVGMHKGEDAEFYLKKGFRVVGVEANPVLVDFASRRLAPYIKSGRLVIVAGAIASTEAPVELYTFATESVWGTTVKTMAEMKSRLDPQVSTTVVPGMRFANLLDQYGVPYYLKIDIEGADELCLQSLSGLPERPKFISMESSTHSFDEVFREFCLFTALGYGKFKIVAQHNVMAQRLPNPPREGVYLDHRFEFGSSGAFGLELPGEWLSLEQAIKRYMRLIRLYRAFGDAGAFREIGVVHRIIEKGKAAGPQAVLAKFIKDIARPLAYSTGLKAGWYDTHAMYTGKPDAVRSAGSGAPG